MKFSEKINNSIFSEKEILIKQKMKTWETITNIEQANSYEILSSLRKNLGFIEEVSIGFKNTILRNILSHYRNFKFQVFDEDCKPFLWFERKSLHPFSPTMVYGKNNRRLGSVKKRFSLFYKKYVICDNSGRVFSTIQSPFWKLWSFPILDLHGRPRGKIQKQWGGIVKEAATNVDQFKIEFPEDSSFEQKSLFLVASIVIDFNHFEARN